MADADAVLGAQPGDEGVLFTLDGEGRDGQGRRVESGTEDGDAGDGAEPGSQPAGQLLVVVCDGRPADAVEFVDGGVESDGAEDVGGAGFFAFGRVGPQGFVEVDEVDDAAAGEERVAVGEGATGPMRAPTPNGAYILCPLHAT